MSPEIRKWLKFTQDGLDLATSIFEALPKVLKVPQGTNNQYLKFLYTYTAEALRLANGAYYSCHYGYPIGGIGAARSIYEICVAIQYVQKAPNERIKKFVRKETEKPHEWSDSRIETMAKKIKRDDYKSLYGSLSHISHIGAMLMDDHMRKTDENKIWINPKLSNEDYCIHVLSAICPCLEQILRVFIKTFGVQRPTSTLIGKTTLQKSSKPLILAGEFLEYAISYIQGKLEPTKLSISWAGRYSVFLYIHTHMALDLAYGAYHGCCHGWSIAGVGAVRSIYETCLNVMYVKSGRNETVRNRRLERFMMSVAEARYDTMTSGISRENLQHMDEEKKREIGNQYKAYKAKYKNVVPTYEKNRWAGISIKQMSKEVGWKREHKRVYEELSQISHVSEIAISDEAKKQTENETHFNSNLNPNDEYLIEVLNVIFEYIPLILDEYIEAFMEPLEIQHLRKVIRNIQRDYRKEVLIHQKPANGSNR